jgi:hypothetical protein
MKITKSEIIGSTLVLSLLLTVALLIVVFHAEPGFDVHIHEGGTATTYKPGWFKNEEHRLCLTNGEWHVEWETGEWSRVNFDVYQ